MHDMCCYGRTDRAHWMRLQRMLWVLYELNHRPNVGFGWVERFERIRMLVGQESCGSRGVRGVGGEVLDPRAARGAPEERATWAGRGSSGVQSQRTPGRAPVSVGIFGDAAGARCGNRRDLEAPASADGTAQSLLEGVQQGVPADPGGELRGRDPARASAGTVHVHQPAQAASSDNRRM
jgi:hypothetical protein